MESNQSADLRHLRAAFDLARAARERGNHPFGSVLVDAGGNVLLSAENTVVTEHDITGHAETNLLRMASARLPSQALATCTLYASTEPCAMCAGAIHWAGIGRLVFGLRAEGLYAIIGPSPHHLWLPCREVFARSERPIEVVGPLLEEEAALVHQSFWSTQPEE